MARFYGSIRQGLEVGEASFEGDEDGLGAIGDVEPLEDDADVGFDGGFLDGKEVSDLAVAVAADEEGEDLALAGAEVAVGQAAGEGGGDGWREEAAAGVHAAEGVDEVLVGHALDEVAHGSGGEGLVDIFVAFVGGDDDDAGAWGERCADFADGGDSAFVGQARGP